MRTNKNISGGILLLLIVGLVLVFAITPDRNISQPVANNAAREAERSNVHQQQTAAAGRQTHKPQKTVQIQPVSQAVTLQPAGKLTAYLASRQQAIVGLYGGRETDNPADNVFTVSIDRELQTTDRVWLNYRLAGVADHSGVACSVNDRLAFGGYLVKTDTILRRQRVQLNAAWLRKGNNRIQFGLPTNATYGYKVTDLALEVETNAVAAGELVLNAGRTRYDGKVYVHGFVAGVNNARLTIGNKPVTLHDGGFEYLDAADTTLTVTAQVGKRIVSRVLRFTQTAAPDHIYALNTRVEVEKATFHKNKNNSLETDLALLKAPARVMLNTVKLSSTTLRGIDLPAMDMGMTNVTSESRGVRFLPHGQHFGGEGATVALKYDRTKIPDGYTENDIRTYYFDTNTNHWVALERDTVNKELCMVVSKTTHFTDMINGVIKTPESPETQGFAPTMMNDIKAADPTAKIEMIAPPTANNQGSANLSYPIELPPARNGMSPNLAISYNSDGGSGWLGEGWDLNIPSITVDTKFGVPRYDSIRETETYNMGGEILARAFVSGSGNNDQIDEQMFFPDRGVVYLRNKINNGGNKYQFYQRIEGSFSQIIRIGTTPANYSWEVTDKSGTKYYYGGAGAELKNPISGDIAEWKLKAFVNIYGDSVSYSYRPTTETVYSSLQANSLYLDKIEAYTKVGLTNKKHTQVVFISNSKKTKKMNNARYGFIVTNSYLLDSIIVKYDSTGNNDNLHELRVYSFIYKPETSKPLAVNTDLLDKIVQRDNTGNVIATHSMDYYNRVSDNSYYSNPVTQSPASIIEKGILGLNNSTVFGNTQTTNKSVSLYVGIGSGITPIDLVSVNNSIGLSTSYSNAKTSGQSTLIDINGDGLADKVYYSFGLLMFCPQYPAGIFDISKATYITGAPAAFLETEKEIFSLGIAGYSNVVKGRIDKDVLAKSKTTSYFSDVNGDGLTDIVYHGAVYFNYISGYNNAIAIPAFTQNSLMTDNPMTNKTIYNTDPIANGFVDYSNFSEDSLRSEASPLQDIVRVWEAPYSGSIYITGNVQLLPPSGIYDSLAYRKADGVRVAIQHNNSEIWYRKIEKEELSPIEPFTWYNSESGSYEMSNDWIYVNKGDRIFFRVQSGDSLTSNDYFDEVLWSPTINYSNRDNNYNQMFPNTPDINGYSYTEFPASDAIVNKSGYNVIDTIVPKIFISSRFVKSVATKDQVKLTIYASTTKSYNNYNSIYTKTYSPEAIADDTLNFISLDNNSNRYFWFVLSSNTNNVRWDKVKWEPVIRYSYYSKDTLVTRNDNMGVNYDIFFDQLNDNQYNKGRSIEIPASGSYLIVPVFYYNNESFNKDYICYKTGSEDYQGYLLKLIDTETNQVVFTKENVKFNSSPYEAQPLFLGNDGNLVRGRKYKIDIYSSSSTQTNSQYTYGFALYTYQDNLCNGTVLNSITLPTLYNKYNRDKNQEFGLMWRNWGQFEYNAAKGRYMYPIEVNNLKLPNDSDNISLGDMRLITLAPDFKTKKYWQGYSDNIKLRGDTMVPARLLMNNIVNIKTFTSVKGPARAPRRRISASTESTASGFVLQNAVIQKPDNPIYHIQAPNIESKEPNIISQNISGNIPVKFLEKIGLSLGVNGSSAISEYKKLLDYIDMNGDGYPDYFNNGKILYSNSRGTQTDKYLETEIENSSSKITSFGVSTGNKPKTTATTDKAQSAAEGAATISLSAGITQSFSTLNISYVDINGDGLPDMLNHQNNKVFLNLGYGFSNQGVLNTFKDVESNFSANAGLGFGVEDGASFSSGVGFASTYSTKNHKLIDINGDGLVDIVVQGIISDWTNLNLLNNITSKNLKVYLNTGDGFISKAIDWEIGALGESSMASCRSVNAALTLGIPIPIGIRIVFNPSGQESTTNSCQLTDIRDYNGDGFPDLLSTSLGSDNLDVKYSKISYTNKLHTITNPLGGKISLAYRRSEPSSNHPGGKWVMDSVILNDGVDDDGKITKMAFDYNNGKYDRRERQFRGFGEVVTKNLNTDNADAVYRKTIQEFDISNYYVKNNLLKTTIKDATNKILSVTENTYYNYNVRTFRSVSGSITLDLYTFSTSDLSDSIVAYTPLKYVKNTIYDTSSNKSTSNKNYYTYNVNRADLIRNDLYKYGFGEIISYKYSDKENFDSLGNGDYNYETKIKYKPLKANAKYVTGLPVDVTVRDKNKIYRNTRAYYTDSNCPSHPTRITQTLSQNGDSAVTCMQYDKYGNIIHKLLPSGMAFTYTYDGKYNMYVTQVTDTFGYTYQMPEYDYRFGIPLKTIDINGNVMTQTVDGRGRIETVTGPNEYVAGAATQQYTIKFEYHPQKIIKTAQGAYTQMPYAITKHYDGTQTGTDKDLETVTFVDGFGRPIQVKKESVVNGASKMIVSGRAKYDAFGRVTEAYYPVVGEMTNKTVFDATPDNSAPPTRTTYDVLDRVLTTTLPDNTTTTNAYSIAEGKLLTRVTDANGKYQDTYTTGDGKTVKTVQYKTYTGTTGSDPLTTLFEYDAINQLVKVTDAATKTTESVYDLAGRRTQVKHPASGITTFTYDAAGNLIEKLTANLRNGGYQPIKYQYDFNRLKEINYPLHPENDVKYVYGTKDEAGPTNGCRAGRLKSLEDGSGVQEYKYGKQGEVTELRRTLVIPNQAVATYVTGTTYDSWNRLLRMKYPDGEVVKYSYNTGGLLTNVKDSANNFNYVENVLYDKFEQRTYLKYGNGKETNYTYKPTNRQLEHLTVGVGDQYIMNNAYVYDAVGNVSSITNTGIKQVAANTVSGYIGGTITHNYKYDNLYRLDSAYGDFDLSNTDRKAKYNLKMQYDNMHNIIRKKQSIEQTGIQFAGTLKAGYELNYTIDTVNSQQISNIAENSYRTEGSGANAPTAKTSEFSYDANGNLIYTATGTVTNNKLQATKTRKLLWDEENRLLGVSDNGFVSQYWYDAAGERTVKESFDNEGVYVNGALSGARTGTSKFTAYVSPYMVVSQGGNYTKHVYMGSQRITSKVSSSGIFTTSPVNTTDLQAKLTAQTTLIKERFDSLGVKYSGVQQTGGLVSASPATTADSYFYHSDHLGSSSLITNKDGYLVQHIQYVPFGEVFVEERNANWSTPYKFNGKEQDEETGLCYYGARYYDPRTSVWLSVDPLAEKYPNWSSYNYCMNNPINVIDPDGKDTFNININTRKIDRIAVENSKTHTYNIMLFGKQKSSTTLDINDKGQVQFPDNGLGFGRCTEVDNGGDHYLEADAAAALFGLSAEMKLEYNGNVNYGDMSDMYGRAPGNEHKTHGGSKGYSGLCVDYQYLDGKFKSYKGYSTFSNFDSPNNILFLEIAGKWGFTKNFISDKNVWSLPTTQINGKIATNHDHHGHLTYIRKK